MIIIMSKLIFERFGSAVDQVIHLRSGAHLFSRGEPVDSVYLLRTGGVDLVRCQADGAEFVLHRASAGMVLAEASLYSESYHCDGICSSKVELGVIRKSKALAMLRQDAELAEAWASWLAASLQRTRQRAELLRRQKVQDRLAGWLDWNGKLPPRGTRRVLAAELGVSPEALYRTIKRMGLE